MSEIDGYEWDRVRIDQSLRAIESLAPLVPENDRRTLTLHIKRVRNICDIPSRSRYGWAGGKPVGAEQ